MRRARSSGGKVELKTSINGADGTNEFHDDSQTTESASKSSASRANDANYRSSPTPRSVTSPARAASLDNTNISDDATQLDVLSRRSGHTETMVLALLEEMRELRKELKLSPLTRGSRPEAEAVSPSTTTPHHSKSSARVVVSSKGSSSSTTSKGGGGGGGDTSGEETWVRLHSPAAGRFFSLNLETKEVVWEATECPNGWERISFPSCNEEAKRIKVRNSECPLALQFDPMSLHAIYLRKPLSSFPLPNRPLFSFRHSACG